MKLNSWLLFITSCQIFSHQGKQLWSRCVSQQKRAHRWGFPEPGKPQGNAKTCQEAAACKDTQEEENSPEAWDVLGELLCCSGNWRTIPSEKNWSWVRQPNLLTVSPVKLRKGNGWEATLFSEARKHPFVSFADLQGGVLLTTVLYKECHWDTTNSHSVHWLFSSTVVSCGQQWCRQEQSEESQEGLQGSGGANKGLWSTGRFFINPPGQAKGI